MQKGANLMLTHIQCNISEQGMAACVKKNNGHQTLAYLLHIMTNIVEAMFEHVVTILMPLGEIATEHRRSRYLPIPLSGSVYISGDILPAIHCIQCKN